MHASRMLRIIRSVQQGVHWLKLNAEAFTDTRDVAITISALIAAEKNPHSHIVQRLVARLIRQQSANGSWSDELWDTVWAARALSAAGISIELPSIQRSLRFFAATQDPDNGTWYEEPFETILVLDLIADLNPTFLSTSLEQPIEWLKSLQRLDGCVIGTRYTGMATSLFLKVGGLVSYERYARLGLAFIRNDLQSKEIWSGAAWSNFYPLRALLDSNSKDDADAITKATDWFLANQDLDGKWMQVSQVHDTAMSVLGLSGLLTTPLVDVSQPTTGILNASKENGTIRVGFHSPGAGAITPAEKMKLSDQVRSELSQNQQLVATALGRLRGPLQSNMPQDRRSIAIELEMAGRYAYGHLIPPRIQHLLEASPADHLRLDIDERLTDLPWELIHDGTEFLCLRYAVGRRLISDQTFSAPHRKLRPADQTRVLVLSNPTGDLPAAEREGREVAKLLRELGGMQVDEAFGSEMGKKSFLLSLNEYDIIHFAGHASHNPQNPDESALLVTDGEIQAFEIARFISSRSPTIVFLNACWSAEERRGPDTFLPLMRGLGKTFLFSGVSAFLGYLVPVPDESATSIAITFYEGVAQGQTIGESVRRARISCREKSDRKDLTWSSMLLYGDPSVRAIEIAASSFETSLVPEN